MTLVALVRRTETRHGFFQRTFLIIQWALKFGTFSYPVAISPDDIRDYNS